MYINSRYADGHIEPDTTPAGDAVLVVDRAWPRYAPDHYTYRWKAGDRIDRVSSGLGMPRLRWTQIMDINPQLVIPTAIQPGTIIRIPRMTQ